MSNRLLADWLDHWSVSFVVEPLVVPSLVVDHRAAVPSVGVPYLFLYLISPSVKKFARKHHSRKIWPTYQCDKQKCVSVVTEGLLSYRIFKCLNI